MQREKFSSRIGFILISAGCAIGLGNVWRFPYIVGQYGGATFILIYLLFLLIFGLPIMTMEFSVGRASQKSIMTSFQSLQPTSANWHLFGWIVAIILISIRFIPIYNFFYYTTKDIIMNIINSS